MNNLELNFSSQDQWKMYVGNIAHVQTCILQALIDSNDLFLAKQKAYSRTCTLLSSKVDNSKGKRIVKINFLDDTDFDNFMNDIVEAQNCIQEVEHEIGHQPENLFAQRELSMILAKAANL